MVTTRCGAALALVLAMAGCSDDGEPDLGTRVGCAWLQGDNCWKRSVAAAHACTDGSATGRFDESTIECTYADSTAVHFDPSHSASASFHADVPWDFTVVASTATTCARYRETDAGLALTTHLGTFTESGSAGAIVFTCPDGSRFNIPASEAFNSCFWDLPAKATAQSGATLLLGLWPAPGGDEWLWRCGP